MKHAPLPGQRSLPFGKEPKKKKTGKPDRDDGPVEYDAYDALMQGPIATGPLAVFVIYLPSGERILQTWAHSASILAVVEHFKRIHPEHPRFDVGIVGVGEFLVDAVEHAFLPDSRVVDERGYVYHMGEGRDVRGKGRVR